MSEEQIMTNREILRDIHSKTNEMYGVVIGNPKARQYGLVDKVHKLEKAENNRTKLYILISSISAGLTFFIHKLIDTFK